MTLAQLGGKASDAAAVPRLPGPPLVAHYLLENPWPVAAGLIAGGIIAFWVMNRKGRLREGVRILVAGVLAGAGVAALGAFVTTEREVLAGQTVALVNAAASARTSDLGPMLIERVAVHAFAGIPTPQGKEAVLDSVGRYLNGELAVKEHQVGSVQAVVDGPNVARTQVRVWAKFSGAMYDAPLGAWFRIDWTRDGDGPWRVGSVTVLQVDTVGVNAEAGR